MIQQLATSPSNRRWLAIVIAALLSVGLWTASQSSAATSSVTIQSFAFNPADLTVHVGDTVTWTNQDTETHAVQGGPFNSPDLPPGSSFSFTFDTPGDVSYICRIHTYMTGVVHVMDGGATTTAPPAPTTTAPPAPTTTTTAPSPTSTTAVPGETTTTTGAPGETTTTTAPPPPPSGGPGFQEVPDDPSATYPPGTPGASAPPPTAGSPTTTTTTSPPSGPPPSYQDVPNDPSGSHPAGHTLAVSQGTGGGGGGPGPTDLGDGTFLAPYSDEGGIKVFHLDMAPTTIEVAPGVTKEAYAFNGMVPGPVLRVNEGDRVRIVVTNHLPFATAVHWHGMILPYDQDGVPGITQPFVEPGETYTYEWTAVATGTHWYHSHTSGRHIGKGLYGALEVIPRTGDFPADRDYRMLLGDTDLGFVINGRQFPSTKTLAMKVGETVHLRVIGTGDQVHAIHLHGTPFRVVAQDGNKMAVPVSMDTLTVSPGQTFDLLATPPNPGPWLLHCHIFAHSHMDMDEHAAGDSGMSGMVTMLDVQPSDSLLPPSPLPVELASATRSAGASGHAPLQTPKPSWLLLAALAIALAMGLLHLPNRKDIPR